MNSVPQQPPSRPQGRGRALLPSPPTPADASRPAPTGLLERRGRGTAHSPQPTPLALVWGGAAQPPPP